MNELRSQIAGLHQKIHGKKLVYFDWAATNFPPDCVVDAISNTMKREHGSIRRGVHSVSSSSTLRYEASRERMARFINGKPSAFIFTSGTTQGLNLVAHCAGNHLKKGDIVLLSQLEHHSHLLPWQMMAKKQDFQIKLIRHNRNGRISLSHAEQLFVEGNVRVIGFPMVSNVLGTAQPTLALIALAQKYDAKVVLDGAQAVGHYPIDVQKLGVSAFAFSGHKLYGPTGIGGLWVHPDWLSEWEPYQAGGGMVSNVSSEGTSFLPAPYRFEAGTPNLAGVVGMAKASDWLEDIGWENIINTENQLKGYLLEKLRAIEGLNLLCTQPDIPLFSFVIDGIHAHDIGTALDFEGIAIRVGHHCAQPLHDALKLDASARISLSFLNTFEECDFFMDALQQIITYFRGI